MKIIELWKCVIGIGCADSLLWCANDHDYKRTYLISFHIVSSDHMVGVCFVFFPISLIIGFNR